MLYQLNIYDYVSENIEQLSLLLFYLKIYLTVLEYSRLQIHKFIFIVEELWRST